MRGSGDASLSKNTAEKLWRWKDGEHEGREVRGRKHIRGEEIPISLQFSILLGRFACIFIQRVSLSPPGCRWEIGKRGHTMQEGNRRGKTCTVEK